MAGRSFSLSRSVTVSGAARNNVHFKIPNLDEPENNVDATTNTSTNPGSGSASAPSPGSRRTLMDIIREEQRMHGSGSGSIRSEIDGTMSWKSFKDRIRLRRAGHAFSPVSDNPDRAPGSDHNRERENVVAEYNPNPGLASNSEEEEGGSNGDAPQMSLMALLDGFGSFADADGEEEEEGEGEEEEEEEEGGEYVCCVCMVRHKGAAFIPCGHTFCRLCSRELWVSRGNCPLCNGFILEILDIF